MRFLAEKASQLRFGWNDRILTESDVFALCKRFKITIVEMPLRVGGFYYRVMGRDYIAVNSRLPGTQKLFVLLHEIGHYLFHTPESGATANFHGVGRKTRIESEADAFALCALIPRYRLLTRSPDEMIADGVTAEMLAERLALFELHGI